MIRAANQGVKCFLNRRAGPLGTSHTVHIDGRRVASCLTLAAKVEGCEVLTIEGLSDGDALHPMQQAFVDHDALQCGYCTPGCA